MRYHSLLSGVLFFLATGAASQPVIVGTEIQANGSTAGQQSVPAVATSASGLDALSWQGPGDHTDIWLQLRAADGTVVVPELRVNSQLSGCQEAPALAFAPDGTFVVVSQSEGQDGSGWGIFGQRFDSGGSLAGPTVAGSGTVHLILDVNGYFE